MCLTMTGFVYRYYQLLTETFSVSHPIKYPHIRIAITYIYVSLNYWVFLLQLTYGLVNHNFITPYCTFNVTKLCIYIPKDGHVFGRHM